MSTRLVPKWVTSNDLERRLPGAKPRKDLGAGFNPPPTRLKDDSWDLHKSDEIFLPSPCIPG